MISGSSQNEIFFLFAASILLIVLNSMTDNFLQTTVKTTLKSFLEIRQFHQSPPFRYDVKDVYKRQLYGNRNQTIEQDGGNDDIDHAG